MLFLTAPVTAQGDPAALLMVLVLAVVVAAMAVRKYLLRRRAARAVPEVMAAAAAADPCPPTAPGSAGKLKLHNVEPKTAALLMAITADKLGKPLNELRFLSIKEVNE